MNKKLIFWLICIFMVGFLPQIVSGAPPITQVPTTRSLGIDIEYPQISFSALNSPIKLHYHLYNDSNGIPLSNNSEGGIICDLHIYNQTGDSIYVLSQPSVNEVYDFEFDIPASNFTSLGIYNLLINCNSTYQGGFVSKTLQITSNGQELSLVRGIIYVILLIMLMTLTILTILGAYSLDGENKYDFGGKLIKINVNKYIKIGLFFLSYLFLIVIFLFCEIIAGQFLVVSFAEGIFHTLFILSAIGLFPIFFGTLVLWFLRIIADFYAYKLKKRGLKPR